MTVFSNPFYSHDHGLINWIPLPDKLKSGNRAKNPGPIVILGSLSNHDGDDSDNSTTQ